ncbi:ABC transporter substrate-binding protein [Phormidesmis sp. 146-33]
MYAPQSLSKEEILAIDGDVLFFLTREGEAGAKTVLGRLARDPLWQHLKVVQKNQAHLVSYQWHSGDIFAINAILDDLYQYLISKKSV